MSEQSIREGVEIVLRGIQKLKGKTSNDERVVVEVEIEKAVAVLVGIVLLDIHRIANAMDRLAGHESR